MFWIMISILLIFTSLYLSKNLFGTYSTPLSLFLLSWNGLFILSNLKLVNYYDISTKASSLIILFSVVFFLGSITIAMYFNKVKNSICRSVIENQNKFSNTNFEGIEKYITIAVVFSCVSLVLYLVEIYFLIGLRNAIFMNPYQFRSYGAELNKLFSYMMITFSIGGSVLTGIIIARGRKFKFRYLLLLLPSLFRAVLTGERIMIIYSILSFIIPLLVIRLRINKRYTKKIKNTLIISIIILTLLFIYVGKSRDQYASSSVYVTSLYPSIAKVYVYTTGSFVAFSEWLQTWDGKLNYGANTFTPVFSVLYNLGVINNKSINLQTVGILEFINIPFKFNVYTFLKDIINDFGYLGLTVYGWLLGLISSYVFYKVNLKTNSSLFFDLWLVIITFYLTFGFIASISTFSSLWYGYIFAFLVLLLTNKKIKIRS